MINVKSKVHCEYPGGCTSRPSYGPPDGSATRCSAHKEPGMANVLAKHCTHPGGCATIPGFGPPGSLPIRCSEHREPGMINVCGKHCDYPGGCSKVPSFGPPGSKARARCSAHKEPGMVNVKHLPQPRAASSSSVPHRSAAPEQDPAMLAAAPGSSSPAAGGTGLEGMGGNLRDSAGEGPPAPTAVMFGGGLAPPLECGSRPALSGQHPATQPRFDPRAEPLVGAAPSVAAPGSAAAARGSSRGRPRQEAQVGDNGQGAVDSDDRSDKKPRGAEPAPPPHQQ